MREFIQILGLLLIANYSSSQIGVNPILVNRIHSNELPFITTKNIAWVHAIGAGLEVYKTNFPISIIYTKDFYYSLDNFDLLVSNRAYDINERWEESFLGINYRLKKNAIGIGYFELLREAPLNLQSAAFKRDYYGIYISLSQSFKAIDIEYKSKINLNGFAAIFGTYPHSIAINYRISNYERDLRNTNPTKLEQKFDLFINLGGRLFNASGIETLQYEKQYSVGFKPSMGIEIINNKNNLGIFLEKDIWITFNAGGSKRVVKDQIINNSIGIRTRTKIGDNRDLRFSLGLNFVRDSEIKRKLYLEHAQLHRKLINNQMRGVLLGINIEVLKNTDFEVRHTIPYLSRNEKLFESKRFSLGINYRFDPLKSVTN